MYRYFRGIDVRLSERGAAKEEGGGSNYTACSRVGRQYITGLLTTNNYRVPTVEGELCVKNIHELKIEPPSRP